MISELTNIDLVIKDSRKNDVYFELYHNNNYGEKEEAKNDKNLVSQFTKIPYKIVFEKEEDKLWFMVRYSEFFA